MAYQQYHELDSPKQSEGDSGFLGVDGYVAGENLPRGMAQAAVNMDFTSGDAKTRPGFMAIPETASIPFANEWTLRTNPTAMPWKAVTYGKGTYVAIASGGSVSTQVATSSDGVTWTSRAASIGHAWQDVAFGANLFVAVAYNSNGGGTSNRVMTSPDGITWTTRTSTNKEWRGVTFGNGIFVAVASDASTGSVMTSPDGITWTLRTASNNNGYYGVTYGGGLFVATGNAGTGTRVMTSPDGITWTTRTSAADRSWYSVAYGNGMFVSVAYTTNLASVMTSPDGTTWTIRNAAEGNNWYDVTFGNGLFVAVSQDGTNRVMTSTTGVSWTSRLAAGSISWTGVTHGGGLFVAVGDSGTGRMMSTPDGSVFATGVYSNPFEVGVNYTMLVGSDRVGFYAFGRNSKEVAYPSGETVSEQATIVQANNQVFIFRGEDEVPLVWSGKWAAPFELATGTIPDASFALYCQNRLWVIVGKDSLWASDVLDFTTFTEITSQFNLSTGDSNHLVTAYPFGDDAIVVFKNRSIVILSGVSGALGDVVATEITRQVGAIGINSVVSVGPDMAYVSDRNINLVTLTSTNNSVQHKILPLSTPIQKIFDRVNWEYGYKISMGYWDNKLYVALPLDNATVCQSVVVYNFVTEKWYGEWNFDLGLGMAILGWVVAPFLGLQRLQATTEDGRIFVVADGYYDLAGALQFNIESSLTTRAYRLDDSQKYGAEFGVDVSTHNPTLSVTAYSSGSGHSVAALSDDTHSRSESWKASDSAYSLTNSGDNYNRAWRRDYAWTVSENVQCRSGFNPFVLQSITIPVRTRLRGRLTYLTIENTTGVLQVNSVRCESETGSRALVTQTG